MSKINKIKVSGTTYDLQDLNATKTVELTQAQYDALTTKDANTFYIITDAEGASLDNYYTKSETSSSTQISTALSNYYTKSETSGSSQISTALNAKQATLVSGTNIKTINNESILGSGNIEIQGGGGSIDVDTELSSTSENPVANSAITTAINSKQEAFTVGNGLSYNTSYHRLSLDVPIYKATAFSSCYVGNDTNYNNQITGEHSFAVGLNNRVSGKCSLAVGGLDSYGAGCSATTYNSYAIGRGNLAQNYCSVVIGFSNQSSNEYEHDCGRYNSTVSGSTTFGNSGNVLMSVGNGNSTSTRHNAFEIRQNGDIYIADTNNTSTSNYYEKPMIKLQDSIDNLTTALGGLSLVKITQSAYDALTTKDSNTLYVIVN